MSDRSTPNHQMEPAGAQGREGAGDITISDECVIALAERGLSFFAVGLRSFAITAVELTPELQRKLTKEFLPTDMLADHARKLSEGS